MVEADDRHAAVCAVGPSDNTSLLAECYKFASQAFKINVRNSYEKLYLLTSDEDMKKLLKICKNISKLGPRNVEELCSICL